jgi:aspartate/methionine/tyrosine aminotransferase
LAKDCAIGVINLPEVEGDDGLFRLKLIADAFLPVGTPVLQAAPILMELGAQIREQIRERVDQNKRRLQQTLGNVPRTGLCPRDGGLHAVIELPPGLDDEAFALRLVNEQNIIVQPGYLFDFDDAQTVIISLLTPVEIFEEGLRKISEFFLETGA